MADKQAPTFERIKAVRLNYNVGGGVDIPTGTFLKGIHGESILSGGIGACTGVVGKGNLGKSTIANGWNATAMIRYSQPLLAMENYYGAINYDTEVNTTESRMIQISENIEGYADLGVHPIVDGKWNLSDKTMYDGTQWFAMYKNYVNFKADNAKKITYSTPFLDRDGTLFKEMLPTFTMIDSISEFETENVVDLKDKEDIGSKGRLTIYMKQGLAKHGMIGELPRLISKGGTPLMVTAHIGKVIEMDPNAPPTKTLQFLKGGDVIKGVPNNFNFLTHVLWQVNSAVPLINDTTKAPEYPNGTDDNMRMDTDLTLVRMTLLRNKFGRSGLMLEVVVSQEQGLLPSLTEFHYLKTNDRYGFTDSNTQNYALEFCPEIKLSRTAIRPKIDKHPELRRTLNILAELAQMQQLWSDDEKLFCTPKELYHDLIAMGYDWPTLLATRGWWTFSNDQHPVPFLSSLDLLRMRKGQYVPYWWPKDKKPIDLTKAK